MKQSLNNLTRKVEAFSHILENKGHAVIQQVVSTPHVLSMQCRIPGKTYFLYVGRGAQYQGFDFSTKKVPAEFKIQDRFLQFARRYWRGMKVVDIEASTDDRVLRLKGVKEATIQEMIFFWRGRDLFFAHIKYKENEVEVFRSWEGKVVESWTADQEINLKLLFKELGFADVDFGDKDTDFKFEEYLEFATDKDTEKKKEKYSKRMNTLKKMKGELVLLNEVEKLRPWTEKDLESVQEVGEGRFKVSFRGIEGHYKKREFLFDKIKGWQKSRQIVKERIQKLESEHLKKGNKQVVSKLRDQKIIQPIWNYEKKKTTVQGHQNHIEILYRNTKCYLGRTAQENDYIRKEFSKKEDMWIHLEGMKSGHMIIKASNELNLDVADFEILASALVDLNGIEISEIPIVYTKVKNIKPVKGSAGMVTYKKEKHLKVYFHQDWRQKLSIIDSYQGD